MFRRIIKLAIVSTVVVLSACQSQNNQQYYWGNYSDTVYQYYNEPGNWAEQENSLNMIIAKSKELNKPIAPGIYAQLGLVLNKQGKQADALAAFQKESSLYPESQVFMQFLQRKGAK